MAGIWIATPESLERLGLGVPAVILADAEAVPVRPGVWEPLPVVLEGGAAVDGAAAVETAGSGGEGFGLPERAQGVGDAVVLIVADVARPDLAAVWARLKSLLVEKNFLRSWMAVEGGDLAAGMRRVVAGTGRGVRVTLLAGAVDGILAAEGGEAVLVTCAWSAHLALVNFVERRFGLRAEGVGRIVAG